MFRQKLYRLWPHAWDRPWVIVQVDGKAICLVVVLHIGEDVVVDVAEKVDIGLDTPVVASVSQRWMLVEEAGIPTAHLVVRDFGRVLDFLLLEELGGFAEEVVIDPRGNLPVLLGYQFWRWMSVDA